MSGRISTGHRRPTPLRRAIFVSITVLLVLAVAEAAGSAFYFLAFDREHREAIEDSIGLAEDPGWNSVLRYRPHPYLNYISNPDYTRPDGSRPHGPLGLRASRVDLQSSGANTIRLVALGGSTTYGLYFEQAEQVWPDLVAFGLGQTLGRPVEAINAGVPYFTSYELLGMASMWLPEFRPDVVLIHIGLNDAFSVGYPDEGGPDNTRFRFSWSWQPMPRLVSGVMRASRLARVVGSAWLERSGYRVGDVSQAMQHPLPPEDELRRNIEAADGRYFRRNVETLITLVRRCGARPVLVDMPINPSYDRGLGLYYDAVTGAVERNNRILHEVGGQLGVPVIALYDALRDARLFVDAGHVNPAGMRMKAQRIYEGLLPLIDGPEAPGVDPAPSGR